MNKRKTNFKNICTSVSMAAIISAVFIAGCDPMIFSKGSEPEVTNTVSAAELEPVQIQEEEGELVDLPKGDTNMIFYEDYRCITNKNSAQYRYQQRCETNEFGIRCFNDKYYAAALGSHYGTNIGDKFKVTLENGTEFYIFIGDYKAPSGNNEYGTPCTNYDDENCTNVIEFIIDKKEVDRRVTRAGTFTALDIFGGLNGDGGNIKEMRYLGNINLMVE